MRVKTLPPDADSYAYDPRTGMPANATGYECQCYSCVEHCPNPGILSKIRKFYGNVVLNSKEIGICCDCQVYNGPCHCPYILEMDISYDAALYGAKEDNSYCR